MKQKYEKLTNYYDPKKFFPVRVDGKLSNRNQFIAYKIGCVIKGQLI